MAVLDYISVNEIIAKFLSDTDGSNNALRIGDMIVWAGEALRKIGGKPMLITHISGKNNNPPLLVENYRAKLPCQIIRLNQLGYSQSEAGPYQSILKASGNFDFEFDDTERGQRDSADPIVYNIQAPYVHINRKDGYLLASYDTIKLDDQGYPMVPDIESVKEAIFWYIEMKLTYSLFRRGEDRGDVYVNAKREWAKFRMEAYGEIMMPNTDDEMEAIFNIWVKLIPEVASHGTSFKYEGQRERFYKR